MSLWRRKWSLRVLMVCTENVCRSPLAEGMLRQHLRSAGIARQVQVVSAGTEVSGPGRRPDPRALRLLKEAGASSRGSHATQLTAADIDAADYVIAMDRSHLRTLQAICAQEQQHKISLLLQHDPRSVVEEVPDPYYGSADAFQAVFKLIDSAAIALADELRQTL